MFLPATGVMPFFSGYFFLSLAGVRAIGNDADWESMKAGCKRDER